MHDISEISPQAIAEYLNSPSSEHTVIDAHFSSESALLERLIKEPISYRIQVCQYLNTASKASRSQIPRLLHDLPPDHGLDIHMVEDVLISIIHEENRCKIASRWRERNIRIAVNLLDGYENRYGADIVSRAFHTIPIKHIPIEVVDSIGRAISKIDPKRLNEDGPRFRLTDCLWSNATHFRADTISSFLRLLGKEHQIEVLRDCFLYWKLSEPEAEGADDRPKAENWYLTGFIDVLGDDAVRQELTDFLFSRYSDHYNFYPIIDFIGGDEFLCSAIKRAINIDYYSESFLQTMRQVLNLPFEEVSTRYPSSLAHLGDGNLLRACFSINTFEARVTYDNICKIAAIHCKEKLISQMDSIAEEACSVVTRNVPFTRSEKIMYTLMSRNPVIPSIIKALGLKELGEIVGTINSDEIAALRDLFPDVSTREFAKAIKGSRHQLLADDLGL